jgi:hypothetical protein
MKKQFIELEEKKKLILKKFKLLLFKSINFMISLYLTPKP